MSEAGEQYSQRNGYGGWRSLMGQGHRHTGAVIVLTSALTAAGWFGAVPALASESYAVSDNIQVSTGLADGFETMGFTCIDEDYRGGYLFVADAVIPYSLASRYAAADNGYSTSDLRAWLNQYFADTLSVAEEICLVKLAETDDSISDRVFCLSIDEVRDPAYKEFVRDTWTPGQGARYYWTRSARENTRDLAYLVQYNGHIASSRVSLTQAGVRPAFVLGKGGPDHSQGRIWYEGDTQERTIHGVTYTFRCIDPNYRDAGGNRAGALFLCDAVIGGNQCLFDGNHNGWAASDLRVWLNEGLEDDSGIADAVTTIGYTFAGKSSDYLIAEKRFTKRIQPGPETKDKLFCLSLEEAVRYGEYLWKLDGSQTNNYTLAGTYSMGYWLRTPAARDGKMCYAVTYEGMVEPREAASDRIGIRPAFVAVQE